LLITDELQLREATRKAERLPWARATLNALTTASERALRAPIEIPERGGQWEHWYVCKKDGAKLQTVSPTEHRCPLDGSVYTGDPYDAVVITRIHSTFSRMARDLGLVSWLTGRADFARHTAQILLRYADRYRSYPRHDIRGFDRVGGGKVTAQSLDEAVWLVDVTWAYALVRHILSAKERARIETHLLLAAADIIREHHLGVHNIQCWKNTAVGLVGLITQTHPLVREALADPARGFQTQIAQGITDDGLWFEGSLGYHYYTMQAIWPLVEAARCAGINLYTDRYKSLYDAPLALALPNGDPPGFNDGSGANVSVLAPLYELAYARWNEPVYGHVASSTPRSSLHALLFGADTVPSGRLVPERSIVMRSAGFAVLRSGEHAIAVRFGKHGGSHGHLDKLNIVTYGAGELFGLDPGSISYGAALYREWYRTTIAHNTVSVDQQLQAPADGILETWEEGHDTSRLVAVADKVYRGVLLRREILLRRDEAIDRFECVSEDEHVYDWAFHAAGAVTTSLDRSPRRGPLGTDNGYQHIADVSEARSDSDLWVRWETTDARLTIHFRGALGTRLIVGLGPGKHPKERVPVLILRRVARRTAFLATHRFKRTQANGTG
jgi:hypothetical protein